MTSTPPASGSIADLYRKVSPSVVSIEVELNWLDSAGGAGFVFDEEGHIVTNAHVVEDARALSVLFHDGYEAPAELIGMDPRVDLAVIKVVAVRHRLKPVTFGDSDAVVVGQDVLAIGSPYGLDATLTRGIISGLNRTLELDDGTVMQGAIQTDAGLAPGNSGGPLVNMAGEVIGVNSAGYRGTALGFAIPSNAVRRIVQELFTAAATAAVATGAAAARQTDLAVAAATRVAEVAATNVARRTAVAEVAAARTAEAVASQATWEAEQPTAEAAAWATWKAADATKRSVQPTRDAARDTVSETLRAQRTADAIHTATWEADQPTLAAAYWATRGAIWDTEQAMQPTFNAVWRALTGTPAYATVNAALSVLETESAFLDMRYATWQARWADDQATEDAVYEAVLATAWPTWQAARATEIAAYQALRTVAPHKVTAVWATWDAQWATQWATISRPTDTATPRPTRTPRPTSTPYHVSVAGTVNIRSGPGTSYDRVGVAQPSETFEVIARWAGSPYNWLKIRYAGRIAWIAESLTRRR